MRLSELCSRHNQYQGKILAPPALWTGPRPTRSAARSHPPRAETPPLPAMCRWPGSLLRSQSGQPSHGRGNASSRPFGNGRWGGRAASMVSSTAPQSALLLALPDMLFCHHWRQTLFDDLRIAFATAGKGPVIRAMQEIANDWAAVESPFEIRVSRAGCRGFNGIPAVLPDNTHRVAKETSHRDTLGGVR